MERESIEDIRRRLLKDEQVQTLISMRAYEIYQMRGGQPGSDAEDWFRAEHEILTFLIQEEARREAYSHDLGSSEEGGARPHAFQPETADRLDQPVGQLAEERAESQSALGVWSPTEPASAEPPSEKRTRSRTTSKSTEPRKRKSAATKEGSEKKPAARRTASKKKTEGESKPKTTRRKPAIPKTEE